MATGIALHAARRAALARAAAPRERAALAALRRARPASSTTSRTPGSRRPTARPAAAISTSSRRSRPQRGPRRERRALARTLWLLEWSPRLLLRSLRGFSWLPRAQRRLWLARWEAIRRPALASRRALALAARAALPDGHASLRSALGRLSPCPARSTRSRRGSPSGSSRSRDTTRASSWRTRSRVTPNSSPISCSVFGSSARMRSSTMRRSRSSSVSANSCTFSRKTRRSSSSATLCSVDGPPLGMKSPKVALLSSSRSGASKERSLLPEALLHVDHVVLADVEALGDQARLDLDAEALELALLLVQPEEELALRARGAEADQPDVVEQVLEDVGADPVRGVGGELHALIGIEALHRLHQADVALLDQVEHVGPGAAVLHRDLHDEAQVREHELARGVDVARARPSARRARAPPRARSARDRGAAPCSG